MNLDGYYLTQRTFSTNKGRCNLWHNSNTGQNVLICDTTNTIYKGFYACAFDSCTIKLNTGEEIRLSTCDAYIYEDGQQAVKRKWSGQKRFVKL